MSRLYWQGLHLLLLPGWRSHLWPLQQHPLAQKQRLEVRDGTTLPHVLMLELFGQEEIHRTAQ